MGNVFWLFKVELHPLANSAVPMDASDDDCSDDHHVEDGLQDYDIYQVTCVKIPHRKKPWYPQTKVEGDFAYIRLFKYDRGLITAVTGKFGNRHKKKETVDLKVKWWEETAKRSFSASAVDVFSVVWLLRRERLRFECCEMLFSGVWLLGCLRGEPGNLYKNGVYSVFIFTTMCISITEYLRNRYIYTLYKYTYTYTYKYIYIYIHTICTTTGIVVCLEVGSLPCVQWCL